jgi:hypothetical protein
MLSIRSEEATETLLVATAVPDGQDNGAGPAIWAVLSTPLLNLLCTKGFGSEFFSPISREHFSFVGYAFVDDTDVIESKLSIETFQEAWVNIQLAVDS